MKTFLLVLLALATAGLALVAWRQHAELVTLRAQAVDAAAFASLQKKLAAAEGNVQELERQLAEARQPAVPAAPGAPAAPRAGTTDAALAAALPSIAAFMDRPEMQRMMTAQAKTAIDRRFAALFKQMNLGPEQLDKFKSLLLEKQTTAMDSMIVAAQQGINPLQNQQEMQKLVASSQAEIEGQIKSLLGDTAYAQYQDYQRAEPQRAAVAQLQQSLGYTDEPLTRAQATQLTQILTETDPRKNAANAGANGSLITDDAIARSRAVLTPVQVQALQDLQQQQQAAAAQRRALFPGAGNPATTPANPASASRGPGG